MKIILRLIAICVLSSVYAFSWLVSKSLRIFKVTICTKEPSLLVIGTFHNPNWFHAHITPLTKSGLRQVILVCDEPVAEMQGLIYECPPRLLTRITGRAISKLLWSFRCAFKYRPDMYMGYHIFPAAISALIVSRFMGRPACYQCTAGPLELEGGGWNAENRLLVALGSSSRIVEVLVHAVVNEFDLVVVRGTQAKSYIRKIGYKNEIAIITGSVQIPSNRPEGGDREFDIIFVGRLTEYKRPDYFVEVIANVVKRIPGIKAIMAGDGQDKDTVLKLIKSYHLEDNIKVLGQRSDVPDLLSRSKVFVLTSRWEGLSIAMIEAMTHGVVPVVSDVGDLRDLAQDGVTGFVRKFGAIEEYANAITALLSDPSLWRRVSSAAAEKAINYSSVDAIAGKWRESLSRLVRVA